MRALEGRYNSADGSVKKHVGVRRMASKREAQQFGELFIGTVTRGRRRFSVGTELRDEPGTKTEANYISTHNALVFICPVGPRRIV